MTPQRVLADLPQAFYSDRFASDQAYDFASFAGRRHGVVVDVGGGCGHFAARLFRAGCSVRVIDTDEKSVAACRRVGIDAQVADALSPPIAGDEHAACFNLILHHLIGASERITRELQSQALIAWRYQAEYIFVNEYVYDSFLGDFSGRLIYEVTSSKALSAIAAMVGRFFPMLKANTLGVGVRFRSEASWRRLFADAGYEVAAYRRGEEEIHRSSIRRVLLVKSIRRDSFFIRSTTPKFRQRQQDQPMQRW